ncbi:MAG: DNA-3-methyladenine glycosylase family protein [Thermodesulfobacteriota bacterium]
MPKDKKAVLSFPVPLDIAGSLSFLSRNGDDYLDRWDGERWVRTLATGSRNIPFSCRPFGAPDDPRLEVRVADIRDLTAVREVASRSFLLARRGFGALLRRDPVLARLNRKFPGIRQVRQFDLFYGLLRAISAQQINLRWAATLRRRLAEAYGERLHVGEDFVYSLRPEVVAAVRVQDLRALQFSTHKAESILAVAEALASRKLTQEDLAKMENTDAMQALVAVRGIGTWSAEWILVRCLGRALVVAGDLGVKKAVAITYLGKETASEDEVRRAVGHWGPHATVAQAILLHAYAVKALSKYGK